MWSCGYVMFMAFHASTITAAYFKYKVSNPALSEFYHSRLHVHRRWETCVILYLTWWAHSFMWLIAPPYIIDIDTGEKEDE